jgi:hypothetical protein
MLRQSFRSSGGAARWQEAIRAPGHYAGDMPTGARELPLLPLCLPAAAAAGNQRLAGQRRRRRIKGHRQKSRPLPGHPLLQAHDTMLAALPASSEAEEEAVTAAASRGQKKKKQLKGKKPSRRRSVSPLAKKPFLCFYHFRFGERAKHCEEPCAWSENE